MKYVHFLGVALLLTVAAMPSQAQAVYIGAQVTGTKLMGDMAKEEYWGSKTGLGFGIHGQVDLGNGHAVVPRIDFVQFKRSNWLDTAGFNLKAAVVQFGADYNYYLAGKVQTGVYVLGGIGYSSLKWEMSRALQSVSETKGTVCFALGAGYSFTGNMAGELRYIHASYSDLGASTTVPKVSLSGPCLQASFLVHF